MKKNKGVVLCVLLITLLFTLPTGGIALPHIWMKIDDEIAELSYPLIMEEGTIFVALEDLACVLKLKATYEEGSKIILEDARASIELSLNDEITFNRGKTINETLYIPLRFVAESFGATVIWQPETHTVLVANDSAVSLESSLQYTILNRGDLQSNARLASWVEQNHQNKGIYTLEIENDTYVLISAGAKPTGGFGLQLESIVMTKPGALLITAELTSPNPGDMVTMAFTYPNIVLKFPNQTFEKIDMALNEPDQPGNLIQPRIKIKE